MIAFNSWIYFWQLERIGNLKQSHPDSTYLDSESYFVFADYSISIYEYVIRLSQDPAEPTPVFAVYSWPHDGEHSLEIQQLASSFPEFIALYLEDSDGIVKSVGV